jgi:osmotically-inducible protein OsmY
MNGVVSLRGKVESEKEKKDIEQKVKNVNGVKGVDSQLEIIVVEEVEAPEETGKP